MNIKQYRFRALAMLIILFFPAISFAQHCEDNSLNLGKIDNHWLYKNEDLKISFQLPSGWYMYDQLATEKKYVQIGTDYRKLSEPLVDKGPGPVVALSQIKTYPLDYALTLLSIAKLPDTVSFITADNEFQQNYILSFKAYYAEIKEVDQLLKILYRKITGRTDEPEIKEGKLGELDYKYMLLAIKNNEGVVENRIFGAKNFGCINMIIRLTYIADDDLLMITDVCKDLKLEKEKPR